MFFSQFGVISRARISGSLALCLLVSSRREESQTTFEWAEKHTLAMLCYATAADAFLSFSLAVVLGVFLVERRKGVWSRRLSLAFFACV